MKQKINIGNILKSYPKETELYSPICGKCYLENVNPNYIEVVTPTGKGFSFNYDGTYCVLGEIMLFPSKENKNWSKITQKICDGDVVVAEDEDSTQMFIVQNCICPNEAKCYIGYEFETNTIYNAGNWTFDRIATEEEKQKLFDAIKSHGYVWDAENKTSEMLIKPKFKVGDKIVKKGDISVTILISEVDDECYYSTTEGSIGLLPIAEQDDWELFPTKFDITTLKPFHKVLVRDTNTQKWTADVFSFFDKTHVYPDVCVGHYTNQYVT
jgi:hypothetical protein